MTAISTALAAFAFHLPFASGQAAPTQDLRDSETRQQQIQSQTQKVAAQIDQVTAEFQSNGIGASDDVKTLKAIRVVLGKLSDEQMQQVVALLQRRTASDPAVAKTRATDAYTDQKDIIAQLRTLLDQYRKREAAYDLSMRIEKLADRQNVNLKATVDLAKATIGRPLNNFTPDQNDSLREPACRARLAEGRCGGGDVGCKAAGAGIAGRPAIGGGREGGHEARRHRGDGGE